jgi:hypothetical protein
VPFGFCVKWLQKAGAGFVVPSGTTTFQRDRYGSAAIAGPVGLGVTVDVAVGTRGKVGVGVGLVVVVGVAVVVGVGDGLTVFVVVAVGATVVVGTGEGDSVLVAVPVGDGVGTQVDVGVGIGQLTPAGVGVGNGIGNSPGQLAPKIKKLPSVRPRTARQDSAKVVCHVVISLQPH